jgi:iron(III) transport system ATP-binding protein
LIAAPDGVVLSCRSVSKRFGNTVALDGFDLELRGGVLMVLLGPSGCGKTTALRTIAGFEEPDSGLIQVGGRTVAGNDWVPPERRRIGMVFQDWALFPHMDVWTNIAFGLDDRQDERVREVLDLVRLSGFEKRMPYELSGGQQQRVALARALAPSPDLILLDEPFSNLDASLRARVRSEVGEVLREAKATAIFVTHDQEEALSIADEVAVMTAGRVLQAGAPHDVYRTPTSRTVATLVGEANFILGEVTGGKVRTPIGDLPAPGLDEGPIEVMVRPETVKILADAEGPARIVDAEFYGHDQVVRVRLMDGAPLNVRLLGPRPDLSIGSSVTISLEAPAHFFRLGEEEPISPYPG